MKVPAALFAFCCAWTLLGAAPADAECLREGARLFPAPGATVPTNARFFLEGFGKDAERVESLVGRSMLLTSPHDSLVVKVQRGWHSAMGRAAVILKVQKAMKPGQTYTLMLGRLNVTSNLKIINAGPLGPLWHAGRAADTEAPVWQQRPTASEGEYRVEDNALIRHVKFHMAIGDESPSFLVVSIRRLRGAMGLQTYFVPVNGDEATIGHDGCTGSFAFEDGGSYRAKLELFDAAGNRATPAEAEFSAPTPSTP